MEVLRVMNQCISCEVHFSNTSFFLSAVCGSNEVIERRDLWTHFSVINEVVKNSPWIISGDFNIMVHLSESSQYSESQAIATEMQEFVDCRNSVCVGSCIFRTKVYLDQ